MATKREERRLAAILAADMVGYSRLMEADESGTIVRQKAHRNELIDPKIAEHNGRIVKTTGDGILVEFASVVDATGCAVAIQRAMLERETDVPADRRIQYRVGINLGDVVIDGGDIFGDGVNVAARLEGIAEPGGVCVSGTAYDHLKQTVEAGYQYLGEQQVKNIEKPVRVYRVLLEPGAAGQMIGEGRLILGRRQVQMIAAAAVVLVATVGAAVWWQPWVQRVEPASVERMALPLPKKPSIAVLPFTDLSQETKQARLASGLTSDIVDALSKLSELFVISQQATKRYKNPSIEPKKVAEELGVRYVLTGDVLHAKEKLLVSVQLMDALSGRQVWSDRLERMPSDLFAIREEITMNVVTEIGVKISQGERERVLRKGTKNLEAWLLVREAAYRNAQLAPEHVLPAKDMVRKAIDLDPNYAQAYNVLGGIFRQQGQNWPGDKSPKYWFDKAEAMYRKALEVDPELSTVHMRYAGLYLARGQHKKAVESANLSVSLMPNNWVNHGVSGWVLNHDLQPKKAISHLKLAMRLNPNFPMWAVRELGHSHMLLDENDKALEAFRQVLKGKPDRVTEMLARVRMAIILAEQGQESEAREQVSKALEVYPKTKLSFLHRSRSYPDPQIYAKWDPILLRLGMPK